MEEWRDIIGYNGEYKVSNLGNVKSFKRNPCKILKKRISQTNNYYQVGLYKNGKIDTIEVHKLVAMSFLGHIPCGMKRVVDHKNRNKLDNRVNNLRIVTNSENLRNRVNSGCVYYDKTYDKWRASIMINRKKTSIAYVNSKEEAENKLKAYLKGTSI